MPAEAWRQCFIHGPCSQSHGKACMRRRGDWRGEITDPLSHQHPHRPCVGPTSAGASEHLSLREGISLRPCHLPGLPALRLGLRRENSCWSLRPQKPQGDATMEVHGASLGEGVVGAGWIKHGCRNRLQDEADLDSWLPLVGVM